MIVLFNINQLRQNINGVIIFSFLFLFFFLVASSVIYGQEEMISIDEIYSGMEGFGKTVFSGTKIEKFDIQVIDIISGMGMNHAYILVKLSGDRIDENGGIFAGMSGSPVYLEGKLAGAISHAWEMSEHNLCLITPIERMLTLFDFIDEKFPRNLSFIKDKQTISITPNDDLRRKIVATIANNNENDVYFEVNRDALFNFQYLQSPLLVIGFDGRANEIFQQSFQEQGVKFIQNIGKAKDIIPDLEIGTGMEKFNAGSAIGVQLSLGDVNVLAIGTATYCKDNLVLAFGHPFMHQGNVSYLFSAVYIYHSFPSIIMPFKIGSPYRLLGEVIQDRSTGILAQLNHFPRIISVKISVHDLDRDIKIHRGAKIVPENNIVQSIVSTLLIESIDYAIDRIGQGTAIVQLDVMARHKEKNITQDNMFFSKQDIALECGNDLNELFELINNNYSEYIELNEIKIDVTIREQNQSAMIKEVKVDEKDFFPGNTVEAQVIIKPFLQPEATEKIKISLPDDIVTGEAILIVSGGASPERFVEPIDSQDKKQYLLEGWDEIQKYIAKGAKNNQIIAELIMINEQKRLTYPNQENKHINETEFKSIVDTDYIIEGYHEIYINIKNDKNRIKEFINE